MRTTRKDTQRQTRDRLMAAAHASIVKEGVVAMSIRNICGAAGHSQGAFYSNFASKGDLLVEIMQSHIQDEVTLMRDLVRQAEGADIEATLQMLADRLAQLAAEPQWSQLSRNGRSCRSSCSFMHAATRRLPSATATARRPATECSGISSPI